MTEKQKQKKEIIKKQDNSVTEMIRAALAGGTDLQDLKDLFEFRKDWEKDEARKAYHKAMTAFKMVPIEIEKDKKVGYSTTKGKVRYSHASLANVVKKITVELAKHGLYASWKYKQNGNLTVTCVITHSAGHHEETSLTAKDDDSGSKNSIQAIGSTSTYLERYTLLALTGLATHDMDNDGGVQEEEKIDENKIKIIRDLMTETKADEAAFLKYLGVEALESLPKSDFLKAKTALEAKKAKGAK